MMNFAVCFPGSSLPSQQSRTAAIPFWWDWPHPSPGGRPGFTSAKEHDPISCYSDRWLGGQSLKTKAIRTEYSPGHRFRLAWGHGTSAGQTSADPRTTGRQGWEGLLPLPAGRTRRHALGVTEMLSALPEVPIPLPIPALAFLFHLILGFVWLLEHTVPAPGTGQVPQGYWVG